MTTLSDAAVSGQGVDFPLAGGSGALTRTKRGLAGRILRPVVAMAPFTIYTLLGLGVPAAVIIGQAFRGNTGAPTLANMRLITHNPYRLGFENSLLLSFLSAIVPGVFGLILAYAIHTSRSGLLRRMVATASGVLANFGGINLTFMFIASLGATGVLTYWLADLHANPWNHGFNLYSFWGVALVYLYFQIPLMVLVVTPALGGLRQSWREASENLGASAFAYWRTVGIPVLLPSVLGGMLLLFGSAFSAYATAETLTAGTVALTPIQIGDVLNGNLLAGETHIGYALALGMIIILAVTMTLYGLLRRRASRWLR